MSNRLAKMVLYTIRSHHKPKGYLLLECILGLLIIGLMIPALASLFTTTATCYSDLYTAFDHDSKLSFFQQQFTMDSNAIKTCSLSSNVLHMLLMDNSTISYSFFSDYIKRIENTGHITNIPMPNYTLENISLTSNIIHITLSFNDGNTLDIIHSF